MWAAMAVDLCVADGGGEDGDSDAGAGETQDAGANDGALVLVGGLIEVLGDVCSASPFSAADSALVLLARRFQAGSTGQVSAAARAAARRWQLSIDEPARWP